jgi:hypothetical protein
VDPTLEPPAPWAVLPDAPAESAELPPDPPGAPLPAPSVPVDENEHAIDAETPSDKTPTDRSLIIANSFAAVLLRVQLTNEMSR